MASVLTSTNSKSGYLYLALLVIIIVGIVYLFVFQTPSAAENWQRQAFKLNAAAFTNGIHLSNARFLTNNQNNNQIDWWQDNGVGLDYNQFGYPIGTDITDDRLILPTSKENCLQIWQFVLGPLQPKIALKKTKNSYWVELTKDKTCVFRAFELEKMQLRYHSQNGSVILTE